MTRLWGRDRGERLRAELNSAVRVLAESGRDGHVVAGLLSRCRTVLGEGDGDVLAAQSALAEAYFRGERYEEAIAVNEKLAEIASRSIEGRQNIRGLKARTDTGWALARVGRLDEAADVLALVVEDLADRSAQPFALSVRTFLAEILLQAGRYDDAVAVLESLIETFTGDLPDQLSHRQNAQASLGLAYVNLRRFDEAILCLEPLASDSTPEACLPALVQTRVDAGLARSLIVSRRCREERATAQRCFRLFEEVIPVLQSQFGPDHEYTLNVRLDRSQLYADTGQVQECLTEVLDVVSECRRTLGPTNRTTRQALLNLAGAYSGTGHDEQALELSRQLLDSLDVADHSVHPGAFEFSVRIKLASAYHACEKFDEALAEYERLRADLDRLGEPKEERRIMIDNNSAYTMACSGRAAEAVPLAKAAAEAARQLRGDRHGTTFAGIDTLGYALHLRGQSDEALPLLESAWSHKRRTLGPDHRQTLDVQEHLAACYLSTGCKEKGLSLLQQVFDGRRALLGPGHRDTQRARKLLQ